jgi:hypothetical protein
LSQELSQAGISLLRKSDMRDRLTTLRKAFDKETKEREATANRVVRDVLPDCCLRILIDPLCRLSKLSWHISIRTQRLKLTLRSSMSKAMRRYL